MIHDSHTDVTERRRATPAEREVLDLLHLSHRDRWVRLSLDEWDRVDRVAAALHDARAHDPMPAPRPHGDRA